MRQIRAPDFSRVERDRESVNIGVERCLDVKMWDIRVGSVNV